MRRVLVPTLVATGVAALVLASGGAAIASTGTTVDYGDCAFGDTGMVTVPAGSPITLTDTGMGAAGNYGNALHGWMNSVVTATIAVTGGTTTTVPLAASFPQYVGAPFFAWLTYLPDISLAPLASGGSVLVTIDATNTTAGETVFPQQKYPAPHFGPFHYSKGDTDETQCLLVAGS